MRCDWACLSRRGPALTNAMVKCMFEVEVCLAQRFCGVCFKTPIYAARPREIVSTLIDLCLSLFVLHFSGSRL